MKLNQSIGAGQFAVGGVITAALLQQLSSTTPDPTKWALHRSLACEAKKKWKV
ncbi:MAG: hypothetical protein JJE42_18200 [Burkholderiales bacterium]|nr:hypothetical protein [Burkholderiales bacterium]